MKKLSSFTCIISFMLLSAIAHAQLSGSYTVGGISPTFLTIQDACDSLVMVGVSGPVVLNIRDGVYTESIILNSVSGVSPVNTITFQSENNDSALVYIKNASGPPTFVSKADHLRFRDLTFILQASGPSALELDSITDFGIDGCAFSSSVHGLYLISAHSGITNADVLNSTFTASAYAFYCMLEASVQNINVYNSSFVSAGAPTFYINNSGISSIDGFTIKNSDIYAPSAPAFYITASSSLSNFIMDSCYVISGVAPAFYCTNLTSFNRMSVLNSLIESPAPALLLASSGISGGLNISNTTLVSSSPSLQFTFNAYTDSINITGNTIVCTSGAPAISGSGSMMKDMLLSGNMIEGGLGLSLNGSHFQDFLIRDNSFRINSGAPGINISSDTLYNADIIRNTIDTVNGNSSYYAGVYLVSSENMNVNIDSNLIHNAAFSGVVVYNGNNVKIRNNEIVMASSGANGIYIQDLQDGPLNISGNRLIAGSGVGIDIANVTPAPSGYRVQIDNNFISDCSTCLLLDGVNYVDILHNSISTSISNGNLVVLNSSVPAETNIMNNILNVDPLNYADTVYRFVSAGLISRMRNNVYNLDTTQAVLYADGTNNYSSVYQLQQGEQLDTAAFYKTVSFVNSTTDLHVNCTETVLNAGYPVAMITHDIDGMVRGVVPTIGADELLADDHILDIQGASICADSVILTAGFSPSSTYSWNTGASTPSITVSAVGTYIVSVVTPCSTITDTAVVTYTTTTTASASVSQSFQISQFTNTSTNAAGYFWDFGDGNTSTTASPTHVYALPGTYTVTLIAYGSCNNDTIQFQVFPNNTSVKEEGIDYHFSAYPNPTEGVFLITMNDLDVNHLEINIINLQGQVLHTTYAENVQGTYTHPMDISAFPSGIYIIRVAADTQIFSSRLIRK